MNAPTDDLARAMNSLRLRAPELGVILDDETLAQITAFCAYLREYNKHTNLVSRADPQVVVSEHVLDSLTLVPLFRQQWPAGPSSETEALSLVDVGSGAGFPAVVLAIVLPGWKVTLVESIGKKARFLESAARGLGLDKRLKVQHARAEELGRSPLWRAGFHAATARAVGPMDLIAELTMPLLQVGGWLFAQKSQRQVEQELELAARALPLVGGGTPQVVSPDAQALGKEHAIFMVRKERETPKTFPRSAAQMKRHPAGS